MTKEKVIFFVSFGLITLLMLFSAGMYFFKHDVVKAMFVNFGYPTYIIYPLAIAKLLGLLAIWTNRFRVLKQWAYAGFFFDFVLAFMAHRMATDPDNGLLPLVALALLSIAFYFDKKARPQPN